MEVKGLLRTRLTSPAAGGAAFVFNDDVRVLWTSQYDSKNPFAYGSFASILIYAPSSAATATMHPPGFVHCYKKSRER